MTFQDFRQKLKNFTLQKAYHRLRDGLWSTHSNLLPVRPAGDLPDETQRKYCKGTFVPVAEENIQDCAAFENPNHYVPVYRDMLQRGDYIHYGYVDGECVFRHCLQKSGQVTLQGCTVRTLSSQEAYIHYGFCAPKARGLGFHAESIYRFCTAFPQLQLFALVREDNAASLRGCF